MIRIEAKVALGIQNKKEYEINKLGSRLTISLV